MIHTDSHLLSGRAVHLHPAKQTEGNPILPGGYPFVVEDWWDRINGKGWNESEGNPAAMMYGIRASVSGLPLDNEVVYGKINGLGHIVHVSELGNILPVE